ncbi:hypothetical protein KCU65_g2816, partial [Aureobasidium melanogenum]
MDRLQKKAKRLRDNRAAQLQAAILSADGATQAAQEAPAAHSVHFAQTARPAQPAHIATVTDATPAAATHTGITFHISARAAQVALSYDAVAL